MTLDPPPFVPAFLLEEDKGTPVGKESPCVVRQLGC